MSAAQHQLTTLLSTVDARGTPGRRLLDNSARLCALAHHLLSLNLIPTPADTDAVDLACSALQLTLKIAPPAGRPDQRQQPMTLRDRAESAAELLISSVQSDADAALLDRTTKLLRQVPQRTPTLPEARLLADAINLEDFGITGLLTMMSTLAVAGDGVTQLLDSASTREQYGYWDARLARFHFPQVRALAEQRLAAWRQTLASLRAEVLR